MGSGLEETPEDLDELGTYEQTMLSTMNESIDIKYRVHIPGEIVEANGTEKDGNVVEYGFDEVVKEEEPYVRSKSGAGLVGSFTQWLNNLF